MISDPNARMAIYETTRELMTVRRLTKKAKMRIVRRLLLIIEEGKNSARIDK